MAYRYRRVKCPDPETQAKIDKLKKMNPKVKKLWVEALLSGEYKQTKGKLKKAGRRAFCCLGVLSDLAIGQKVFPQCYWDVSSLFIVDKYGDSTRYTSNVLDDKIVFWSGVADHNPFVYYKGKLSSLAELNDAGVDFEMIAGIIINQL